MVYVTDEETNEALTKKQKKTLRIMRLAAKVIMEEDKKLFEELAKR